MSREALLREWEFWVARLENAKLQLGAAQMTVEMYEHEVEKAAMAFVDPEGGDTDG